MWRGRGRIGWMISIRWLDTRLSIILTALSPTFTDNGEEGDYRE